MTTIVKNHAIENALGHLESIQALMGRAEEAEGDDETEAVSEEISEYPLSVQVRSDWHAPGDNGESAEYEILLTTGGPALRIIGKLGRWNEPENARLEWQDWGTPWTELHPSEYRADLKASEADALLLSFACHFYFGEGA